MSISAKQGTAQNTTQNKTVIKTAVFFTCIPPICRTDE